MKYFLLALLLLLGWATQPAIAQITPPTSTASPSATHLQAAETLLNTIYTDASFNQLIEQELIARVEANANVKPYLPEMRAFLQKYMSWSAMRPQLTALYAREFSILELEELTRFYQSPVGRKASEKLPLLMRSGMEIGQQTVQQHLPELTKTIEEKAKKERSEH